MLAALATDPRIADIAAALLDTSSVRLWQDQLLFKPPGDAATTTIGWHQDWASWDTVASHPAFVTAWVAFDDVDDDNGAMQMIPRSHERGLVPGGSNFFATDRDAQLAEFRDRDASPSSVLMQAGQVSFHHPLTFHGSGHRAVPRTRGRARRAVSLRRPLPAGLLRYLFAVRSEGGVTRYRYGVDGNKAAGREETGEAR